MLVLHAAKLANRQALAGGLQFFVAHVFVDAGLAAFGSGLMGSDNGAVLGYVLIGIGI